MRWHLLAAVVCVVTLHCRANPIVTINAEPEDHADRSQIALKNQNVESQPVQIEGSREKSEVASNKKLESETSENESEIENGVSKSSTDGEETKPIKKATSLEETPKKKLVKAKVTGRQSSDDDDDDDDDDDLDLGVEDDDDDDDDTGDDDDDDDDDDEGGDYFERLFDDILGGEDDDDDDDDDDDVSPSTGDQATLNTAQRPSKPSASITPVAASAVPEVPESEASPDEQLNAAEEADGESETGALEPGQPKMPAVYIAKYNRFVDVVLNRINRLLGKQYDPVRVKLLGGGKKNVGKNNKKNKNHKNKNKTKAREEPAKMAQLNKMGELELARYKYEPVANNTETPKALLVDNRESEFVLVSKVGTVATDIPTDQNKELRVTQSTASKKKPTANTKKTTTKKKNTTKATPNKGQIKQSSSNKQKPRATLFGLSSLKRDGDVSVNMMADHTTVKTNFIMGPLTLRVEREMAKSGKKVLRSATATTAEMYGRLNLRIINGGVATLHSIRVLQPKQVRIDASDDHDKTREFMWKRSPQIATMVSQKLATAARSMLKPPPQPRP